MIASHSWTWHFHLITVTLWVGSFSLMAITPLVYHTIHHFVLGQCYQFISVSPTCSREVIQSKFILCNTINLHFHDRHSWTLCRQSDSILKFITLVLCHWCGIHQGPPTMSHFLSTSTHYPRSWLRNTLPVPWGLHASMAGFSLPMIGLHRWPSTERLCMVFNIKSSIHTMQNVLQYLEDHYHYRSFLSHLLTTYIIGW